MKTKIGQEIRIGEVVTHMTASAYADMSVGFVRGFIDVGPDWNGGQAIKVQVTWVWMNRNVIRHPVKTSVMLDTLTRVDIGTLSIELQSALMTHLISDVQSRQHGMKISSSTS